MRLGDRCTQFRPLTSGAAMTAAPSIAELERAVRGVAPAGSGEAVTDAFMEAVAALRRVLLADDPRLICRAAEVLARVWMARLRHRAARRAAAARMARAAATPRPVPTAATTAP